MEILCHHAAVVGRSPVVQLVYEGANALVQDGHAPLPSLELPVAYTDEAVYATSAEGDEIGVICFRRHYSQVEVRLMYVEPSSRRAKVMTRLWKAFMDQLKREKMVDVVFSVVTVNSAGLAFAQKVKGEVDVNTYAVPV